MSTMRAIQVAAWGEAPKFLASVARPPTPPADSPLVQIKVLASGLHQLVRSQAAGAHYTVKSITPPYTPGSDGVGLDSQGNLVYFSSLATGGAMAEYINVPRAATFPVPTPSSASEADKRHLAIRIATLFNPAMSAWMALHTRTSNLPPNPTVLILGATSLSGQIAIKHARHFGAKTIIGVARNTSTMASLDLDIRIKLEDTVTITDFSVLANHHVDVILDYLYGQPAVHLLNSLPSNPLTAHEHPIQYVQIGSLADADINLSSAILRSKNITLRGSGPGSWSVTSDVRKYFPSCLERLCDNDAFQALDGVGVQRKLEDVDTAWAESKKRSVFVV